jgi:hypothetical protein
LFVAVDFPAFKPSPIRTVAPDTLAPSWAVTVPMSETVDGAVGLRLAPQPERTKSAKRIVLVCRAALILQNRCLTEGRLAERGMPPSSFGAGPWSGIATSFTIFCTVCTVTFQIAT